MATFKIGMVMLGVDDMERSVAFYRDRAGFALESQFPGFAFFNAGNVTLILSKDLPRTASSGRAGSTELVLPVDHVRAAYDTLKEAGVEFSIAPRPIAGPNWASNFTDPDGHQLSIFGPE